MIRFQHKKTLTLLTLLGGLSILFAFSSAKQKSRYVELYHQRIQELQQQEINLIELIQTSDLSKEDHKDRIRQQLQQTRNTLKGADFWLRYLNNLAHKKINGPLPVEWETEVFEKFEKPYKREGSGLTLAYQYLDEQEVNKTELLNFITQAQSATEAFYNDTIVSELNTFHHFYFCNRLFLLNLGTIYTTGFECPDANNIIPELRSMFSDMAITYQRFNESFPETPLPLSYLTLFEQTRLFVLSQPSSVEGFDHYTFLRDYVNPLFAINQQLILQYKASSRNLLDYSLNKQATSIFSKSLYNGQNPKGIFLRLHDTTELAKLEHVGKLLFYDPILSQNNQRSCVSCHQPNEYFTDTNSATAINLNGVQHLDRNTPSLLNAQYNHLLMADGNHYTLVGQTKGVIENANEMGCTEAEALERIKSCKEYVSAFNYLLKYTPQETEITMDHICSAITYYYSKFSKTVSPFDEAMNQQTHLSVEAQKGFNLFMGKAQCATCHFVPQFNGVKPPYIGSEFEVLGVPELPDFATLSDDKGRYAVNPATETMNAFRTGTIRNAAQTQPYMHNGVFKTLEEVIDFYNQGGGAGRGLHVPNQTLSSDSLQLSDAEKKYLITFIETLTEKVVVETPPLKLPLSKNKILNTRMVGGIY